MCVCRYMILFFSILITIGTFYTEMRKSSKLSSLVDPNDDCKKFTFVHENLTKKQFALADKFWSCFSLHKNYEFIMSPNLGKDSLEPIHGIRAFGIFWIIIGMSHTIFLTMIIGHLFFLLHLILLPSN